MDNLIGKNLGRYHVIEPLGQGGMASVYKAFDNSLERNVAIKIIRTDMKEGARQTEFLKRFQREARALAQLDHPYILKVLDYGEQDGTPYVIMPFVPGGTLKARMGDPIPYQEAAAFLAPIAQALDYAHHCKIIHRDVKPANILISESNSPLLSDFGIAKILESEDATQLTASGVGIGTPDYMAPEQWLGKVDPRIDIYSLGIVFYQMVTGRLPFTADTPAAVLLKHMNDPLPRPASIVPDLPEAVENVLYKALAKDPENRFQDMRAFADALGKLAQGDVLSLVTVSQQEMATLLANVSASAFPARPEKDRPPVRVSPARNKTAGWKVGLIAAAFLAVLIFAVFLLAGGVYLATKLASNSKATTTYSADLQGTRAVSTLPDSLSLASDQTQTASDHGSSYKITPFLTIEGFPADIPILTENNGNLMKTTTQEATIYQFTSNMAFQQVVDFYKSGMASNGWKVGAESTESDLIYWTFSKGDSRNVMITITRQPKGGVVVSTIFQ